MTDFRKGRRSALMALLIVFGALSLCAPAAAEPGDYTPAMAREDERSLSSNRNYVKLKRDAKGWSGPGLKLRETPYAGGTVWMVVDRKPQGILVVGPGLDAYRTLSSVFVRKDVKHMVVIGTQGSLGITYRTEYKYGEEVWEGDEMRLFSGPQAED